MRFSRNIGLLTEKQQIKLSGANIAICGVGGMGGVAAEALVRMGVGRVTIVDHDRYELSNMNRQIHCTQNSIGKYKVDVIAERLMQINPDLAIRKFYDLCPDNVEAIIADKDLVINGMDDILASITLERRARELRKVIVDAWITPFASVFVMTPNSPHWEEFLNFPTRTKAINEITEDDLRVCLEREVAFTLRQFDPFAIIPRELVSKILNREIPRPSLVPVVWMSGTLMANEAMKVLTQQGRLATHWGVFYNQYDHEVRYLNSEGEREHEEQQQKLSYLRAAG